ncbi:DUF4232 domain-containing protein [Streptomyces sp. NPDC046465]|uniref:DUF4232 domain-containing protein n=1 Tax=Streptomyces sp. NPDC046465 TaxID=3155810 RepID=UPI0033CAFE8B
MRSRRAARSAHLALAAVAVAAFAATATACGPDDTTSAGTSTTPAADSGKDTSPSKDGSSSEAGSNSGASAGKSGSAGDGKDSKGGTEDGYGQACGTNDLTFTLTSESQAGGYYLVAAKAKSGITCSLDVNTPSVSFGSDAQGVASPVGQGGEDPIKLSGSAVAYTGISPKSTDSDGGTQFESVILGLTENDPNPAELKLPEPADVDKPIVTNWSVNRSETVPVIS